MTRKLLLTIALIAATLPVSLVAQGKDIKGEINFFTYRDDLAATKYSDWIAQFNKVYPNIKVNISASKNFQADLKVKFAANDTPDVFTYQASDYSDAIRTTYLLPLDDQFPNLVSNWTLNGDNVVAATKKTYGLNFGAQGVGLVYNKAIFKELGLKAPKTLDDVIAAGKKIKAAGKIGLVGCFKPGWTMQPYTDTAQILFKDQDKDLINMTTKDAPFEVGNEFYKMMQVVEKLRKADITEDDPVSYDWEPYLKDFGSGKAGMAFTWTDIPMQFLDRGDGTLKLEDIGFVPFPYDNTGGPYKVKFTPGWSLAISKNSKNMEAAKAFFQWHLDTLYAEYAKTTTYISARKGVTTDISYMKEFDSQNPIPVVQTKYPPKFKAILEKAQLDIFHQVVDVFIGQDPTMVAKKMNAAWKKARASVK